MPAGMLLYQPQSGLLTEARGGTLDPEQDQRAWQDGPRARHGRRQPREAANRALEKVLKKLGLT
jgi:hypothetical protein